MDQAVGYRNSPLPLKKLCLRVVWDEKYSNKMLVLQLKAILDSRKLCRPISNPVLDKLRDAMYEVMLHDLGCIKQLQIANVMPPQPLKKQ